MLETWREQLNVDVENKSSLATLWLASTRLLAREDCIVFSSAKAENIANNVKTHVSLEQAVTLQRLLSLELH
jgi:hypothetical protein